MSGPPDGYAVRQLHPLPVNAGEGSGAHFAEWCDFRDAELQGCDLRNSTINGDFRGALLFGCDLSKALIVDAQFEGAAFDETTKWPFGGSPPPGARDLEPTLKAGRQRA